MLRGLRKKIFRPKDLPQNVMKKWDLFYLDNHFEENKFFRLCVFLRDKGVDLNAFFDDYYSKNKNKFDDYIPKNKTKIE